MAKNGETVENEAGHPTPDSGATVAGTGETSSTTPAEHKVEKLTGCVAKFGGEGERASNTARPGSPHAAVWNRSAMKPAWTRMSRPPMFRTCPFLIIAIAS